jgi:hypothetical protein
MDEARPQVEAMALPGDGDWWAVSLEVGSGCSQIRLWSNVCVPEEPKGGKHAACSHHTYTLRQMPFWSRSQSSETGQ